MAAKKHPHTTSVEIASKRIDAVLERFDNMPRFMQKHIDPRTIARHERIDSAAPDVQAWKGRLTLEQIEKLAKLDGD